MGAPRHRESEEAFARDLTTARTSAGLSIREVSRITGIPAGTLGGYFVARHLPPLNRPHILSAVLSACGVPQAEHPAWRQRLIALYDKRRHIEVTRTPYPGLRPFAAEDHDLYFGREDLIERLLDLVTDAATQTQSVVMVVGPSGSGKSSLLGAGLQHVLPTSACTMCTPVDAEAALAPWREVDQGVGGVRQVLIVDHLEELWTHPGLRARAAEVINDLTGWAAQTSGRVVVFGLRADFYGEAMRYPALADALGQHQVLVEPLDAAGMRAVIEGPAQAVGLELEAGLIDVVLADIRQEEAGSVLPHLAHVLETMWGASDRTRLTLENYRGAGGLEGAIRQSAEETLTSLPPEQAHCAMTLLLRMVTSSGAQGWTRRVVPLAEVRDLLGEETGVLNHLVERRLVTVRTDDATLSHESLIAEWPRLREAVDARRTDLARREELNQAATEWVAHGRVDDHLLRGSRLQQLIQWSSTADGPLTPVQQEYLAASQRLAEHIEQDQVRGRQWRRAMTAALAVLLLVSTGAGLIAFESSADARTERDQAQSRQMAVASASLRSSDPGLSQQLAVGAYQAADTRESRSAVLDASTTPVITQWEVDALAMERSASVPGSDVLVLAGPDGGAATARPSMAQGAGWEIVGHDPDLGVEGSRPVISRLAAHPEEPWVMASGTRTVPSSDTEAPLLVMLDLHDPAQPVTSTTEVGSVPTAMTYADGGSLLLVADQAGQLHRFGVDEQGGLERIAAEPLEIGAAEDLAASADGSVVAAALADGTVLRWSVRDSQLELTGQIETGRPLFALDLSADGASIAAVGRSGLVHWLQSDEEAEDGLTETHGLFASDTNVFAVEIDDASGIVAASGWEGSVAMWRIADGEPVNESPRLTLPVPRPVLDMALHQGRWVFATLGGATYTWDSEGSVLPRLPGNILIVGASREGDRYLTSTGPPDGAVSIWDASDPHAPTRLHTLQVDGEDSSTGAGALSTDGSLAAAGTSAGHVVVWDISGEEPEEILNADIEGSALPFVLFTEDGAGVLGFTSAGTVAHLGLVGDERGQVLGELSLSGSLYSAAVRDDGVLALSDDTGAVRLVNVHAMDEPLARLDLDVMTYGLDFSPDGDTLALSSSDDAIRFYDVSDPSAPEPIGDPLTGPTAITNSVKFSPDGQRLAVAVVEGQAWLFDATDDGWEATEVLGAGLANLQDIAWSADGSVLLGGSLSGVTRLWLTDVDAARAAVCAGVGVAVTEVEWEGLLPGVPFEEPCAT